MDSQVAGRRTAPSGAAAANPNIDKNKNDSGRKRPRQEHECIIELNPPRREGIARASRTFRVSSSESDVDAASMSAAGEEQQCFHESEADQGGDIPTSFAFPQETNDDNGCQSNRSDRGQIIQSSVSQLPQRGQQPCQVYRGENICPFCGYKCVRTSLIAVFDQCVLARMGSFRSMPF